MMVPGFEFSTLLLELSSQPFGFFCFVFALFLGQGLKFSP
jgi:hypothetical protein